MCDPISIGLIATTLVTAGGQLYAADAASEAAKYEARVADRNAEFAAEGRRDAQERGKREQMQHWRKVSQRMGRQRAEFAGMGVDINFGTPADVVDDTLLIGMEDASTIAENTRREVKGFDIEAANYRSGAQAARMKGKAAKTAGWISAGGTILGGATQVAGRLYNPSGGGGGGGSKTYGADMTGGWGTV